MSFMSLLGLLFFVSFFLFFLFVYLLVLPFLCSFLFFPQKYVCLCLFRFCHFHTVSISFHKISRFFCLIHSLCFSTFFENKFLFLWTFHLIFWYSLLTKKTPCSNFHFDRPRSYTYVSCCFFYLLTLFMFPLLCMYPPDVPSLFVHPPHCYSSFFLLPNTFFKKKNSPFCCCKTFVLLFSLLFRFLFSSLSVKPLQLFFSFLVSSFFFVAISNLVLSNKFFSSKKILF